MKSLKIQDRLVFLYLYLKKTKNRVCLMCKTLQIGSRVSVLNDTIKGKVTAIQGDSVIIEDVYGFERIYQKKELIVYGAGLDLMDSQLPLQKNQAKKPKKSKEFAGVVDLHYRGNYMKPAQILEDQLRVFVNSLNIAIAKKQPQIIFIHGEGSGVLRTNIEKILRKNKISFSDAPYHTYGQGAVEVYLRGVKKRIKP